MSFIDDKHRGPAAFLRAQQHFLKRHQAAGLTRGRTGYLKFLKKEFEEFFTRQSRIDNESGRKRSVGKNLVSQKFQAGPQDCCFTSSDRPREHHEALAVCYYLHQPGQSISMSLG
jgi:hypothetical protein